MKRHFVNDDYFSEINSEVKAYLLGFFIADGCIGMNERCKNSYFMQLNICYDDRNILEWVQKEICPENKITITNYQGGDVIHRRPVGRIKWTSNKMKDDLYSYNIHMRKTYEKDFIFPMERIPEEFIWDFIRGFFDGDGCMSSNYSFNFCGTSKSFLEQIGKVFEETFQVTMKLNAKKETNVDLWNLRFDSNGNKYDFIKKVYEKFYSNKIIFLDRKRKNFEGYLKSKYRGNQVDSERLLDTVERS